MTPTTFPIEINKNLSPATTVCFGGGDIAPETARLTDHLTNPASAGGQPILTLYNPLDEPAIQSARIRLINRLAEICRAERVYSDDLIEFWHQSITTFIITQTKNGIDPNNIACKIHDITNLSLWDKKILLKTPSTIITESVGASNV